MSTDFKILLGVIYYFAFFAIYLRTRRGKSFVNDYLDWMCLRDLFGVRLMRRHWVVPVFTMLVPAIVLIWVG